MRTHHIDGHADQTIQRAIFGGRISAYQPTGNSAIDALLVCADSTDTRIAVERVSAAVRVRPTSPEQASRALGIAVRPVDLRRDNLWWRTDAENLVVRWNNEWCAVVSEGGRPHIVSPNGNSHRISHTIAHEIASDAWGIIPVFTDQALTLRSAWKLGWTSGGKRDLFLLMLLAAAAMVMGTVVPIVSGIIVGELVPSGEVSRIFFVTVILLLAAVLSALLIVAQSIVTQRMSGRFSLRLISASYERVFRLKSRFHREHVPGELVGRLSGVEVFASGISTAIPTAVALGALLLSSALVLSQVSIVLTLVVLGFALIVLLIAAFAIPQILRDAQASNDVSLELGGMTFSILGGIAKIRTAGAEERMLNRWIYRFARQQAWTRDQMRRGIVLGMVSTIPASLLPLMLVLVEVAGLGGLSIGAFTSATAASAQAGGAIAGLIPVTLSIAALVPTMRSLQPILTSEPEPRGSAADDPGQLMGDITFENIFFHYQDDAPVLSDVSMHIPPGSMTAIVGPSGSGKSTMVRLLLGLEEPSSGQVLFDGRALSSMDRAAVLDQMGIVPQDAALIPGSIMNNILGGASDLGDEAAWLAAERAGIAEDIRAMPMGMHTVISDGASTFSGGQRQRIMIARALVREPRILVLDEATSALDNRTQEQVANSISAIGATRIVIAHRLSTIQMADRIIVLESGKVVEVGTYPELLELGGAFHALATRQLV